MRPLIRISVALMILFAACKKKPATQDQPAEPPVTPVAPADSGFKCANLPPVPVPFGWTDTTADVNKNVKVLLHNPLNADEVIVVVEGDIAGYNQLTNVNLKTKKKIRLAALDEFLPSINARGWIVYSTADNNIFAIKSNGDSLKQITDTHLTHDPKWDASGKYFYYLQDAHLNVPAQLLRSDLSGNQVLSIPQSYPLNVSLRKSDRVILQKRKGTSYVTLVMRDLASQTETELIEAPYVAGAPPHFNHLTVDHHDENLYWSNKNGIFKWNFTTGKTENVFKNCENTIYDFPVMSLKDQEMTFSVHTIKPVNTFFLLHEYKAMEYNTLSKEIREIRVFQ